MPRPHYRSARKEFTAWAIRVRATHPELSPHLDGILLGRHAFDRHTQTPESLEGSRVALFRTREVARRYARPLTVKRSGDGWRPWAAATPVLVRVHIELARAE